MMSHDDGGWDDGARADGAQEPPRTLPDGWPVKYRLFDDETFELALNGIMVVAIVGIWAIALGLIVFNA